MTSAETRLFPAPKGRVLSVSPGEEACGYHFRCIFVWFLAIAVLATPLIPLILFFEFSLPFYGGNTNLITRPRMTDGRTDERVMERTWLGLVLKGALGGRRKQNFLYILGLGVLKLIHGDGVCMILGDDTFGIHEYLIDRST